MQIVEIKQPRLFNRKKREIVWDNGIMKCIHSFCDKYISYSFKENLDKITVRHFIEAF